MAEAKGRRRRRPTTGSAVLVTLPVPSTSRPSTGTAIDTCTGTRGAGAGRMNGTSTTRTASKKILLLHGNHQTGQLLLGRLDKLRKRLAKEFQLEFIAPDAPFKVDAGAGAESDVGEDADTTSNAAHNHSLHLTWWNRVGNDYQGLDRTLELLRSPEWNNEQVVGIMGFSQGARLCHLLALLHRESSESNTPEPSWFPSLQFVIMVAGYDAPLPDQHLHLWPSCSGVPVPRPLTLPSMHVWGLGDLLISPSQSESVSLVYNNPTTYVHPGKHFVPTKGPDMQAYLDFIRSSMTSEVQEDEEIIPPTQTALVEQSALPSQTVPDEESAAMQQDEVQALEAIFPEEIQIVSPTQEMDGEVKFDFPIVYNMKLLPNEDDRSNTKWPVHPLTLQIVYPYNYPFEAIPNFRLVHANNNYEFASKRVDQFMAILKETSQMELGMPSVLSGIYAVKEYLDAPPSAEDDHMQNNPLVTGNAEVHVAENSTTTHGHSDMAEQPGSVMIPVSSPERIRTCNLEGLEIAERILNDTASKSSSGPTAGSKKGGNGGSTWNYVIGLVGKPSAGKSTFFNAATAFSRQRGCGGEEAAGDSSDWGGASMAAHPFTTIDPNIGYCLIPASFGSCPEDTIEVPAAFASTHGRSPDGRRFLPVLLKDVAGLVPGAYEGRGRGNQFLNDLTDATVLIHVVDASGTADAQGNKTVVDDADETAELTNPLDDLAWIRNELVEWVYSNVTAKWDTIRRKGRAKLSGMFSGYGGLREAEIQNILTKLEHYLEDQYQRDHALGQLDAWDQGDVHRLVSAFLGVRFPMALALNKCDLPSSQGYVKEILNSLPIDGAHAGTPMAAEEEMLFVRNHLKNISLTTKGTKETVSSPTNVWECLTSAMRLREPVLVFPVSDMTTLSPLLGLSRNAAGNASLPSSGMIRCIEASGGSLPSCWDPSQQGYVVPSKDKSTNQKLRDVLVMKPGSTVEDVFVLLKRLGAVNGDFVRAEAKCEIGDQAKPIPKLEVMRRSNRIIKIMSNKRAAWQS